MRTGILHAMAWSLATGAAVTLSWWGVHTVMAGTAYDPPRALPITTEGATGRSTNPVSSSTHRPAPAPSAPSSHTARFPASKSPDVPAPRTQRPPTDPHAKAPAKGMNTGPTPDSSGKVRSYVADGGRVVFEVGGASAQLVSATPDSGWQMQVWTQPTWIRVTFSRDGRESSVFCTWHDHAPLVELDQRHGS